MSADRHFELRLLGEFGLRYPAPSEEVIVISSKKARALLAYVAMQEAMHVNRERLAMLLWPDRIDRQARQNLRKCIASLRADLASFADELLTIDGEAIGIKEALVVDARQLRKLAEADAALALEEAAALCRGQFLAGLAMDGEEFRDWAAAERAQLESAAGTVLSKLAGRADQAGDARKALQISSRLTAMDPLREDWLRLSLRISARYVGRDQALVQARSFVALLRKELDVEPEAETADLIEQIKDGRIAPVRMRDFSIDESASGPIAPTGLADRTAARPRAPATAAPDHHPALVSAMVAAIVAVLVASLSVAYGPGARRGLLKPVSFGAAALDRSTIPLLILPLQAETAETTQLARDLTDNLLASVSRFSGLAVVDGRPAEAARGRAPGDADRLAVRFSTWGSVRRDGSQVRLKVGLNDTTDQTLVWAADVTESDDGIAKMGLQISQRIARELQVQTTYATARAVDGGKLNLAASNQLVAKALTIQYRSSTLADDASAASLYEEARRRDSGSPLPLIGLAAALVTSSANLLNEKESTLPQAEELIKQALLIDPGVERAHYWLGNIYLGRGRPDLALQSFDRALQLNPGFIPAEAHAGFALVLLGRPAEGLKRIENALDASSHDPEARLWLRFAGIAQLELGNDRQALDCLLQAASLAPAAPPLRAALAAAYALLGQHSLSREQFGLVKGMADPGALDHLLMAAAKAAERHSSRYLEGLRIASSEAL
jgi:DNA-binding SARP family transcriptional activator/tetratricopeptide (TPR) repeat protein